MESASKGNSARMNIAGIAEYLVSMDLAQSLSVK
jgi:hypothetical protein